jgi:hypothetical protein
VIATLRGLLLDLLATGDRVHAAAESSITSLDRTSEHHDRDCPRPVR